MKYVILVFVALAVMGLAYIRLARDDVARWHVDPQTVKPGARPNQFLMRAGDGDADSPVFHLDAEELAQAFDAFALSQPRVTRLAGGADQLWTTYIQRSKWFGFPDYISVRFVTQGAEHSSLAIYSRARYGRSDRGVNKARIDEWVTELRRIEAARASTAAE